MYGDFQSTLQAEADNAMHKRREYRDVLEIDCRYDGIPRYGAFITWTVFGEGKKHVGVENCQTMEMACERAKDAAINMGWTYPRWWEFWRWNDSRPDWARPD